MILNPIILEDIEHTQKANESHVRAFDSIIDKVYREDKERKEKAENARKKKEAILHKQEPEKRKAEEAEQRATAEEVPSSNNDIGRGEMESVSTSGAIGSTWSEVTPEVAANYMEEGTGVSASVWAGVIYRESSNNPYALNSLGCFGYLQIMQSVHGNVSSWSPQAYLDKAIEIYHSQGPQAWEAW